MSLPSYTYILYTIIVPIKNPIILYKLLDFGMISSKTTYNIVPDANDKNIPIKENDIDKYEINKHAEILRKGNTVIFPTETVYGLGANALTAFSSRAFAPKP